MELLLGSCMAGGSEPPMWFAVRGTGESTFGFAKYWVTATTLQRGDAPLFLSLAS